MKIAYLISAHQDSAHFGRLVKSLYVNNVTAFFVHIDKKSDIHSFRKMLPDELLPSVVFLNSRCSVSWGGYSQCEYQKELIRTVFERGESFDRYFFISGLDYPLWSNERIINYLNNNPDKEFIKGMDLTNCFTPPKMQTRVVKFHYRDFFIGANNNLRRLLIGMIREVIYFLGIRKNNYIVDEVGNRLNVYCGSSWWCLSYNCMRYIYEIICIEKRFETYFKTALAPDELMIHTIVFNSTFKDKCILHKGEYPGLVGLTPLHYIEYEGAIAVWTERDFDKLVSSGKMFCRKLMTGVSDELIEKIDKYRAGGKI